VFLAGGTWLALGAQLLDMAIAGAHFGVYQTAQALLVAVGLAGCAPRGRRLLFGAAAAYLALFLVRLFLVYTWKFLDTDPWPVAVWNTFILQWLMMVYFLADGWLSSAVSMLFYEWLMPLAQALVLGWLIIRRRPAA
jgi:hypothetical protein